MDWRRISDFWHGLDGDKLVLSMDLRRINFFWAGIGGI
jgi:hypothetical protein